MRQLATIFKALGDDTRLEIVKMLIGKELCVCDIIAAFANKSQPAISHHLKILKHAGVLSDSRDGKWIFYSINSNSINAVLPFLKEAKKAETLKIRIHPCADNEE
ncbi:ArsR/SmtB family transcription factor [Dendrosporobacter sp. 1207_IL3150]|uniref:ArsR/SmtB family transcription factor n=1 Tax=Dendrosporobacter sp. 1207_IL3150 TaxID=3084054 RepID=UPI002FDAD58E